MSDEDKDSKTEDPSEKKLEKAKEEGSVASSQEVKATISLMMTAMMVGIFAPLIMVDLKPVLAQFLSEGYAFPMDFESLRLMMVNLFIQIGLSMAVPMLLIFISGIASSVVQSGLMWSPKALMPKLDKFSPIKGAKRLASSRSLVEFVKSVAKLVIVGGVMGFLVVPKLGIILSMATTALIANLITIQDLFMLLLTVVIAVMVVLSGLDVLYQRFKFKDDQKMTKQEVKDENKSAQGDPMIKARIAQIRNERTRQRMMAAVPTADVVVTNPTHYAIALDYKQDSMDAPILVAKGMDSLALKIREVAEEHNVPIVENPPLARGIYATVELDQEIPPEHYKAVAEVIGYVMRLKGKAFN